MRIAFIVNPVHTYNGEGWSPTSRRLSGTEESIVQWAEQLVKMGCTIDVFKNGPEMSHNGVRYLGRDKYIGGYDAAVNVKSSDIKPLEPTLYLTNETNANLFDLSKYAGVVFPSLWAKQHIRVNNKSVHVLAHGYDPLLIWPGEKVINQVLYASSPDRGLQTLLDVWPSVYQAVPGATLKVTYGADGPLLPGVEYMGDVDDATMSRLYRESDIWCHPCNGGELYGMTGIKAQAAGCVPVYFPIMALSETVKGGVASSPELLQQDLIDLMRSEEAKLDYRLDMSLYSYPTWESTAEELLILLGAIVVDNGSILE